MQLVQGFEGTEQSEEHESGEEDNAGERGYGSMS